MSADRAQQEGEVVDLTARLLAGVLADSSGADLIRQVLRFARAASDLTVDTGHAAH
jgi:hypothetical protein